MFYACFIKKEYKYDQVKWHCVPSIHLCGGLRAVWESLLFGKAKVSFLKPFSAEAPVRLFPPSLLQSLAPWTLSYRNAESVMPLFEMMGYGSSGEDYCLSMHLALSWLCFHRSPPLGSQHTIILSIGKITTLPTLISFERVGHLAIRGTHWDHEVFFLIPWSITMNINLTLSLENFISIK